MPPLNAQFFGKSIDNQPFLIVRARLLNIQARAAEHICAVFPSPQRALLYKVFPQHTHVYAGDIF